MFPWGSRCWIEIGFCVISCFYRSGTTTSLCISRGLIRLSVEINNFWLFSVWHSNGLIHFFFNEFTSRWFHLVKIHCSFGFRGTLTLHAISLGLVLFLIVSWESLTHVPVTMIFFVDQVIGGGDVVVTVGFHTPDGIFLFKLVVFNQFR